MGVWANARAPERTTMIYDLQKASMWKRISAWLFDVILLAIVAVLFAWGISAVTGFDGYNDTLEAAYAKYGEAYGVDFDMSLDAYQSMTADDMARMNEAYAAMSADDEAVYAYNMVIQLTLLITSLGILGGFAVMEFIIPMALKNGQTLGKKIFGVAVMFTDGVQLNGRGLFVRTFLGKFAVETMAPVLLIMMIWFGLVGLTGTLVLLGIMLINGCMLMFTKNRWMIHDALASTVTVDLASQMIFPDKVALIAYKEKIAAEKAAQADY